VVVIALLMSRHPNPRQRTKSQQKRKQDKILKYELHEGPLYMRATTKHGNFYKGKDLAKRRKLKGLKE
jgi:hypothetical protein